MDSGLCRAPRFNAGTGLTQLHVTPISQASATQRAGRAAREGPGACYRLWSQVYTTPILSLIFHLLAVRLRLLFPR